jgi:hypothetical protein
MNEAIKLNPNFQTTFRDRGTAYADRRDYDETIVVAATVKAKLSYAVTFNYHSSYENRREGDRIIQDANPPIRNNQYNAYAYTPGTFPPASPPLLPPEPVKVSAPTPAPAAHTAAPKSLSVRMPEPRPNTKPPPPRQHAQPQRHVPPPPAQRKEPTERFSLFRH